MQADRPRGPLATSTPALLGAWAALSVAFLAILVVEPFGAAATVVIDDYACVLAPAAAGFACWAAGRRSADRARRAWSLLACSMLLWAGGGVAWTVYEVHLGQEVPFPSLADAGYLAFVPPAVVGLLSFPGSRLAGAARLRPLLDGAIAAGSLLFISWMVVLGSAVDGSRGPLPYQVVALAYPICDVLTATIALLTLARARGPQRLTMLLVGAGLLVVAIGDTSFAWFTARGAYQTGNLFDTGFVAGFLLIGVAAWRHTGDHVYARAAASDVPSRLSLALPYLPLLVSAPIAVVRVVGDRPLSRPELSILGFVVVVVLLRQLLSLQMNLALSTALHDTVATLRRREVELNHRASHDPLTGLANRALFAERVTRALARTRHAQPVIVLLADLDDFKVVNDTLGHQAGDALLVDVAARLRAMVRPGDTVARLGGDEFAVLLDGRADLDEATGIADRIVRAVARPFEVADVPVTVGTSIGIATGQQGASHDRLLRDADIAMYSVKASGKGGYAVFGGTPDPATPPPPPVGVSDPRTGVGASPRTP